jgi:hypothetical protein
MLPFEDHVLNLRNEKPDIFERYDEREIARQLLAAGALHHDNVMLELAEANLQTFRRRYDPNFDVQTRPSTVKVQPRTKAIAETVLGSFKADTVMRDGRPLSTWTWGEFRAEFKGMAAIMTQYAHLPDDDLIGDTI